MSLNMWQYVTICKNFSLKESTKCIKNKEYKNNSFFYVKGDHLIVNNTNIPSVVSVIQLLAAW